MEKAAPTPGPGSYLGAGAPRRRPPVRRDPAPSVQWERVPTAPSIPNKAQCFGYEEGPRGELVLQQRVDRGYSGLRDDHVGPADYKPGLTQTRIGARVVDFARTRSGVEDSPPGPADARGVGPSPLDF